MSSRAASNNRTPLTGRQIALLILSLAASLWQRVTCNASRSNFRFLLTRARVGKNTKTDLNALHVTTLQTVVVRGATSGAVVLANLWRTPRVVTRISDWLTIKRALFLKNVMKNPKLPTFRSTPANRTMLSFSVFMLAMGLTLLIDPGDAEYLGFQGIGLAYGYGIAFLVTAIMSGGSAVVWPTLNLNQQLWLRTTGCGACLAVSLGWAAVLLMGTAEHTGDWTAVTPWVLIIYFEYATFSRYTAIDRDPPSRKVRSMLKHGRT